MNRHDGRILLTIDDQAPTATRVQQLLTACTGQADSAESLAEALDHVTDDSETTFPLRTIADWLAARSLLSDDELGELHHLIKDVPANDVRTVAQASLPRLSADLPRHCTGTWPTVLHLLRRNMLPNGLPPLLAFVEHLAAARPEHQGGLQDWSSGRAERWGLITELQSCRSAAASFTLPEPSPARVMFVLLPDGLQKDYYTLRMWHREGIQTTPALRDEDTQTVSRGELPRTVAQRLTTWLQKTKDTTLHNLSIEFWLPITLVNEPVWEWCKDVALPTAGAVRNVSIRSLDRQQLPTIESVWRARWEGLMQTADTRPARTLPLALSRDVTADKTGHDPVILDSPPDDRDGRTQFLNALRSGAPAILWHRRDCSPAFRNAALNLINDGPLYELPDRISALRAGTLHTNTPNEFNRDITLLWDDPDNPLPTLHTLVAPSEAGTL
ncbi:hypothetical protein [Streptomyces sp. NPDC051997]|uniref:VMAP-C domain-containing protein n=1 Tax=Streptomyces sp. NPDC051997 TaxID=3155611 RepID=UPI00343128F7